MWLGKTMSQIKVQDDLQSITNHPDFCIYRIICCYDGNKQKILFHLAKYMYQNRTKSVDLRLPLFDISCNSRGKRDFFPSLLAIFQSFRTNLLEPGQTAATSHRQR